MYVAQDGILYTNQVVKELVQDRSGNSKGVAILIPILLGLDSLNSIYHENIKVSLLSPDYFKKCFEIPSCIGIAGGRPNSSLFFTGYQG